jgi:cytochrome c-type biogenesis protein CcmH
MSLWLLMTILCSAAAVGVSIPLIRRLDKAEPGGMASAIYQDQLDEVDRDVLAGTLNKSEAENAKLEIQRRLKGALKDQTEARPISARWRNLALVATAGLVILGSVNLYNILGSPDLRSAVPQPQAAASSTEVDAVIAQLAARVKANPSDAEGWRLLGSAQFNAQHFPEAADAYAKAVALRPENTDDKSAYAEALVQAAQGVTTPQAKLVLAEVLAKNPKDARARFYDALAHEQSGDQPGALDRWLALLAETPAGAGWREVVKQHIADLAKATGRDVSAALAVPIAPPLNEEQKSAIQAMAPAEQQKMIETMVGRLAGRLAENPKDIEGWTNLMRAYKVLNDDGKAKQAKADALMAFSGDADGTAKINVAAVALGLE